MKRVVYDAGVLIAADGNDRRRWAEHRVLLEAGFLASDAKDISRVLASDDADVDVRPL